MRKLIITIFIITFMIVLTSCQYDVHNVLKENVRWQSNSELITFEIQGPGSKNYGYGQLKVNDSFVNVFIILSISPKSLSVYLENNTTSSILDYNYNVINSESLLLTDVYNKTNDPNYDDLEITIYREDLSLNELDARIYFESYFNHEEYQISLHYLVDSHLTYSAFGSLYFNHIYMTVKLVYIDEVNFEVYDSSNNELLFSGTYETEIMHVNLDILNDNLFNNNVDTIRLSVDVTPI